MINCIKQITVPLKLYDVQANKGQKLIGTVKCIVTCDTIKI